MSTTLELGKGQVATSAGVSAGKPAIIFVRKFFVPQAAESFADLVDIKEAFQLVLGTPEAALSLMQLVIAAVQETAIENGVDMAELRKQLPTITAAEYQARQKDLLEANNRYLQRARDAEAELKFVQGELDTLRDQL